MARTYRATAIRRVANALMKTVLRVGFGPSGTVLLTTIGRRSGRRQATPVNVTDHHGERWLVSPYGTRGWVHNVRASGGAELRRGRRVERVRLEQVDAATAAPVLREYAQANSITRPYFDAAPDAPLEEFEAEASRHPVFHIAGPAAA